MAEQTVKRAKRAQLLSAVWVLSASVFAAVSLWAPRAVMPQRLPPLHLDRAELAAAEARDEARLVNAPRGRWPDELRGLYGELGRKAQEGGYSASHLKQRLRRVQQVTRAVVERHGIEGLWALRAEQTAQLDSALAQELPTERQHAVLGEFPEQLARYHVRSADGTWYGPRAVARVMFKARWNALHDLPPTAGFEAIETQAYEGWLALHGEGAPVELRYQAAARFAAAGGYRGEEALAVWAARLGQRDAAREALQRARAHSRAVHLRNYALALR